MKKIILTLLLLSQWAQAKPKADIAIALDTSGSMEGLITQVRDGLWQTLNGLGEIKKNGEKAELRLALFEYGSGVVDEESHYIQLLTPLTADHTKLAEKLFATKAQGSQEYSGKVISLATNILEWSTNPTDFRSIVIAGNETIHQGPVDPLEAIKNARNSDILVNSIFAGSQTIKVYPRGSGGFGGGRPGCHFCPPEDRPPQQEPEIQLNPIFAEWKQLSQVGGGETLNIDHNNAIPYIESPFDKEIIELTEEVNTTYLPFGPNGEKEFKRMKDLDRQVRNSGGGSYMDWGRYRDGGLGRATQASWDLVSALEEDENFDLAAIPNHHLPEALRGLSLEEKKAKVLEQLERRKNLKDRIDGLNAQRKIFVDDYIEQNQAEMKQNFATALKKMVIEQLEMKGFQVGE